MLKGVLKSYNFQQSVSNIYEEAETLMDPVKDFDMIGWIQSNAIQEQIPVTSVLINYLYSSQSGLNEELQKTEFSSSLSKVNIPTLLLYGKYDFICPSELGEDIYNRISSTYKKLVISPVSGHNLMVQDESLFCKEVNDFIKLYQ
jgi:pimeloyl-ACP methyl ester carboxylesterase